MKYQYFFLIWFLIVVVVTELASRNVFQSSAVSVIAWWLKQGDNRVLGSFLFVLFGLLFLVFISARTSELYLTVTGKAETYVFTGDKLREGFYGYQEQDPNRQEVFVPSFMDANLYPATSFQSLFNRQTVLRSAKGEVVKTDMLGLGNQIVWSIFTYIVWAVWVAGLLIIFKSYAQGHGATLGEGIGDSWQLVQTNTRGKLGLVMAALAVLVIINVALIRWRAPQPVDDGQPVLALPAQIKSGNRVSGKIVASETYNPEPGSDRSIYDKRAGRRYTVQFDKQAGFQVPVYVHWDAPRISEDNLNNKSKEYKRVQELQKDYYDAAFAHCDAAQQKQAYVVFLVTDDWRIIPYLEEKKALIPTLLENLN